MKTSAAFLLSTQLLWSLTSSANPAVPIDGLELPSSLEIQQALPAAKWTELQTCVRQAMSLVEELFPDDRKNLFRWQGDRAPLAHRSFRIVLADRDYIEIGDARQRHPLNGMQSLVVSPVYSSDGLRSQEFIQVIRYDLVMFDGFDHLRADAVERAAARLTAGIWGYIHHALMFPLDDWIQRVSEDEPRFTRAILQHTVDRFYTALNQFSTNGERHRLLFMGDLFRGLIDQFVQMSAAQGTYAGPFVIEHAQLLNPEPRWAPPGFRDELERVFSLALYLVDQARDKTQLALPFAWDLLNHRMSVSPTTGIQFMFIDTRDVLLRRTIDYLPLAEAQDRTLRSEGFVQSSRAAQNQNEWFATIVFWMNRSLYPENKSEFDSARLAKISVSLAAELALVTQRLMGPQTANIEHSPAGLSLDIPLLVVQRLRWLSDALRFVQDLKERPDLWNALTPAEQKGFREEEKLFQDQHALCALALRTIDEYGDLGDAP